MAAHADFYLLPGALLYDLHVASAPRKREVEEGFLFKRTKVVMEDDLVPFLLRSAKHVSRYDGSGYAFSMLDRVLGTYGFETLFSDRGFAGASATTAYFDPNGAKELLERLRAHKMGEEEISDKVRAEIGGTDDAAVVEIFRAWRQMQEWLGKLDLKHVGVLCIVREGE
jgi:hypothetical protein